MYKFLFVTLLTGVVVAAHAQKPCLSVAALDDWPEVANESISLDGSYLFYQLFNRSGKIRSVSVVSTDGKWRKEIANASGIGFSADSRTFFFRSGDDSLNMLRCPSDTFSFLDHATSVKLAENYAGQWVAYAPAGRNGEVVLRNLRSGKKRLFTAVKEWLFDGKANYLLLKRSDASGRSSRLDLVWLARDTVSDIWQATNGDMPFGFSFDSSGRGLAFLVEKDKAVDAGLELWIYKTGESHAELLLNNDSLKLDRDLQLGRGRLLFRQNATQILFTLEKRNDKEWRHNLVKVDVWSYLDTVLQSVQAERGEVPPLYYAVVNLPGKRVFRIENENESVFDTAADYAIVTHSAGRQSFQEAGWNIAARTSYFLVSTKDGSRRLLKAGIINPQNFFCLSATGKWVIYYDFVRRNYFSYEVETGITRNLTKGIDNNWTVEENRRGEPSLPWTPLMRTWLFNDRAVLIYDNFDVWEMDPAGKRRPLNLTNKYGRKHSIKFDLINDPATLLWNSREYGRRLFLRAFDKREKSMGFWSIELDKQEDPRLGTMGPYIFGKWDGYGTGIFPPMKAGNAECYLVFRQSSTEAPNLFFTKDFKLFYRLSDIQPQREYNWLTAELKRWKTFDGSYSTGILYKPEDFDPSRKYPVIFDYYERRSDELHLYIAPKPAENRINIAWFVSKGYLVFTPDIGYTMGEPGPSAYNAVVSAAYYLARFPWVDHNRMGVQGHSFGGYETDYLVTHTGIFAAACSASGFCDLIGWYGSDFRGGYAMYWAERNQGRLLAAPWQNPDRYVRNSPIFRAGRVTTPLLMMNNKDDRIVPFAQGVEFFTALRRLGRRVWLLQYDEGRHSISGPAAVDYTIRMTQFFDHYLKNAPAPVWMTRGIPFTLRDTFTGYDTDAVIATPGPGLNR